MLSLLDLMLVSGVSFVSSLIAIAVTSRIALRMAPNYIEAFINDYIERFLDEIHKKPQAVSAALEPLILDLAKRAGGKVMAEATSGSINDGTIAGAIAPMLPKKWQGAAALVQMFLGGGDKQSAQSSAALKSSDKPFG
jgi:hypothetical protein